MILNPDIFFNGDLIDLSFVCNNGQIDNLLLNIEESLYDEIFEEVGTLDVPTQSEIVNVLKYFVFVEMMTAITNDFNANYVKSYFANILQNNPTLAFEMTRNKITQAKIYAYREVQKFELDGWKIYDEFYELSSYL